MSAKDAGEVGPGDGTGWRERLRPRRPSKATIAVFGAVLAVGIVVAFLDLEQAWTAIRGADLRWMAAAVVVSLVSYGFLSASFGWIFRQMGIEARRRDLMLIGFTSSALNNLMPFPSVAGHGIRVALLNDRGVSTGDSLAASAFHSYLTSFVLLLLFPFGLFLFLLDRPLPTGAQATLSSLVGLTLVLLLLMSWVIFHTDLRRRLVDRLGHLLGRLFKGGDVRRNLEDFDRTIEEGIRLMRRQKSAIAIAVLLDLADWALTAATLWFCFLSFGVSMPIGTLLTGFVVGIVVGLQSVVPGGLGLQEASLAGMYALLGVPFTVAVLAALLFRVTYHIIPFVLALATYAKLLHRPLGLADLRQMRAERDG